MVAWWQRAVQERPLWHTESRATAIVDAAQDVREKKTADFIWDDGRITSLTSMECKGSITAVSLRFQGPLWVENTRRVYLDMARKLA